MVYSSKMGIMTPVVEEKDLVKEIRLLEDRLDTLNRRLAA